VVAGELGIAPSTLRLWSTTFPEFLSAAATKRDGARAQRRYDDEDRRVLRRIGELLARERAGDYEQVTRLLLEGGFRQRGDAPADGEAPRAAKAGTIHHLGEMLRRAERTIGAKDDTIAALEFTIRRQEQKIAELEQLRKRDDEFIERLTRQVKELLEERLHPPPKPDRAWWERLLGHR
jgi:DNA-binding transcriptional MerR regulator